MLTLERSRTYFHGKGEVLFSWDNDTFHHQYKNLLKTNKINLKKKKRLFTLKKKSSLNANGGSALGSPGCLFSSLWLKYKFYISFHVLCYKTWTIFFFLLHSYKIKIKDNGLLYVFFYFVIIVLLWCLCFFYMILYCVVCSVETEKLKCCLDKDYRIFSIFVLIII